MDSEDAIENEFTSGQLSYFDAIQRLENIGYSPFDAEQKVNDWEE